VYLPVDSGRCSWDGATAARRSNALDNRAIATPSVERERTAQCSGDKSGARDSQTNSANLIRGIGKTMTTHKIAVVLCMVLGMVTASLSAPRPGDVQSGQTLFMTKCVPCHGKDGTAKTAMGRALGAFDLHSAVVQKLTDAEIYTQIDKGRGNMPPFGSSLDTTQINDLVSYVRSLGKKQVAAKKAH
jgi:mono/diheme cytochrome c family protein